MFGPISYAALMTIDVVAPGAPTFELLEQQSNTEIKANVRLPSVDAGGQALTGLKQLRVVSALEQEPGVNPFEHLGPDELAQVPGAQVQELELVEEQAGLIVELSEPVLALGRRQWFAATCSDE